MKTIPKTQRKYYYLLYGIAFFFIGTQYAVPGALFVEIQNQLNITTQEMSIIYSAGEFSIGLSALIVGYFIDHLCTNHSHILLSILGILGSIGYYVMIYIESYFLMLLDWIIVSAVLGAIECAVIVYLYRVTPTEKSSYAITINFLLMGIGSTFTAYFIADSISYLPGHSYVIPLDFMAILCLVFSIGAGILKTPTKIDETITTFDSCSDENKWKDRKNETIDSKSIKGTLFFRIMISILIGLYAGQKASYLSLGVTYSTQYMNLSRSVGLTLITSFWTAKTLSQLFLIWIVLKYKPATIILLCEFCMVLNASLLILIEAVDLKNYMNETEYKYLTSTVLIVVWALAAFVSIPVYVVSFPFIKTVEKMTGFVSALILIMYTGGCALFVFIAASLYQQIGPWTYPFVIFVTVIISLIIWIYTHIHYLKYQQHKVGKNEHLLFKKQKVGLIIN